MAYDESDVNKILQRIVYAVSRGRYKVAVNKNRQKNSDFIKTYKIESMEIERILMNLTVNDFVSTGQNVKVGYEHEQLHVFGPKLNQIRPTENLAKDIVVYIKVNIIEKNINDYVIVVSFHEAEHEMDYPFQNARN